MGCKRTALWQGVFRPAKAPITSPFSQSDQILCRFRLALQHESGPRIALPAHRLYYPVDIWPRSTTTRTGLLWRSPRFSVITQRARMQRATAVLSDRLRFFMCRLVLCGSSAGQSRRKKGLSHPGREPRGWRLHAGGEQRGHLAAPGRQMKWVGGRMSRRASRILYWFVQSRVGKPRRRLEHKISLHKAASEVRYVVIFNHNDVV
jgi:hypothetical protein